MIARYAAHAEFRAFGREGQSMTGRNLRLLAHEDRGVAAVEFAIIAPLFLLTLFGIICFGILSGTYNAVQRISADAARAAIAGLTATEQAALAQSYVSSIVSSYGFIDPKNVTVTTASNTNTFSVTVSYDMSNSYIFALENVLNYASPIITRTAAIQTGSKDCRTLSGMPMAPLQ
jgi:Flp pilus assembly protein TadG